MRRKFMLLAALLLAAAALLSVPQASSAQGFAFGGRNFGISVGQPYYGGYGYGGYGGYGYYPGWSGYNTGWYNTYPYGGRYAWGGYPSYGGISYGTPYYSSGYYPSYANSSVTYSYPTTNYRSFYPAADVVPADQNAVRLRLRVPENARVWFNDTETQQRGMDREFLSPPLTVGKEYVYQIKAQWLEDGREVTRQKQVTVRAGDALNLDLMSEAANQREAAKTPANNAIPQDRDANPGVRPAPNEPPPADPLKARDNPAGPVR